MPVTDPISDMFTRIRNAIRVQAPAVEMPASKAKVAIAELLRNEGFISSFETRALGSPEQRMRIVLKYGSKGEHVIQGLKRVSKPGLRVYRPSKKVPRVL
jgi:small subunit ribosomal protein S8